MTAGPVELSADCPKLGSPSGQRVPQGRALMPQLFPPSYVFCPSLPIRLQCIFFPSEKNENYWNLHCAPTMCSLSLNAFIPGFAPLDRRGTSSRTSPKGS